MVHGVCLSVCLSVCLHGVACLRILNSLNISRMHESTFLKFGKSIEYGRVHPGVKSYPEKAWSWSYDLFKTVKPPFSISGMDEATLFKFGKWIDYSKSHRGVENSTERGVVWVGHVALFKTLNRPSVFLEWMKWHSLNLASGSTAASPTKG